MDDKQFKILVEKLDRIHIAIAMFAVRELKTQTNQALALSSMGFKPAEIAKMLGTSPNTIRTTLSRARKQPIETAEPEQAES